MKFRIGQKVNYKGNFNLKNPCTIMGYDERLEIYKVIDRIGERWSAEDRVFAPIPPKYYYDADIYGILADRYNMSSDEIAEELKVKRIWCEGNSVVCEEFGEKGDDNIMEVGTDELVQLLCRKVDGQ